MARKRSLEQTYRGFHTGAVPSTSTPTACPVCGETPAVTKGEKRHEVMEAHLKSRHQPDDPCHRTHRTDMPIDWKLDWDAMVQGSQASGTAVNVDFIVKRSNLSRGVASAAPLEFIMKPIMALTCFLLLTGCSTMKFPPMVFLHPVTGATGDCPGRTITAYTPSDRKAEVALQDWCVQTWLAAGYVRVK